MYDPMNPMNINENPETSGSAPQNEAAPSMDNFTPDSQAGSTEQAASNSQASSNEGTGTEGQYAEYRWQGSDPQNPYQNQSHWANQPGSYYEVPQKPKKERKPLGCGAKTALKIVAGVLCCAVISAASVGGFAALINNGVVQVNNAGSGNATFTINKLINSDESDPTTTVSGDMTQQEVAAKVLPSVVCIQNYQQTDMRQGLSGSFWGQGQSQDDGSDSSDSQEDSGVSPTSEGSGIIATSDGYIITNAHVVEGADSLKVITSDNQVYEAELIGSDTMTDLAVIKVDATGLTAAEFGSSDDLQVADPVIAIGNPGGLSSTVTVGYVSALDRPVTSSDTGYTMNCIQTDAAINPGNSGGALVNMYGQVIGINSSKIVAEGYEGLGFAIPIDTAQPVIYDLQEYGYVKDRAMLGISGQYLDDWSANFYGLPSGMYVAEVSNESVTEAGIQRGDVITQIDDTDITSANTISNYIMDKKPGDTVTLSVTRGLTGETFTCEVTLTESTGQ